MCLDRFPSPVEIPTELSLFPNKPVVRINGQYDITLKLTQVCFYFFPCLEPHGVLQDSSS